MMEELAAELESARLMYASLCVLDAIDAGEKQGTRSMYLRRAHSDLYGRCSALLDIISRLGVQDIQAVRIVEDRIREIKSLQDKLLLEAESPIPKI